nr:helix-turn-helix domain-containing protein [uncultured Blautia sp.]
MLDNYTDVLTVKEAQEILKINKKTLYRLIDNREIFAKKIGKVYRIPKQSLCEYILGEEQ